MRIRFRESGTCCCSTPTCFARRRPCSGCRSAARAGKAPEPDAPAGAPSLARRAHECDPERRFPMRTRLITSAVLALLALLSSAVYTVDRAEFVYLAQFGRHVATYDGETDAGLHVKWPW